MVPDAQGKEVVSIQPSIEMIAENEKEVRYAKPKGAEAPADAKGKTTSKFGDTAIENLHSLLLKLCYLQAQARSVAPYMILGGPVLEKLAIFRPTTIERFRDIEGVDEQKALEFGPLFTEAIKVWAMCIRFYFCFVGSVGGCSHPVCPNRTIALSTG